MEISKAFWFCPAATLNGHGSYVYRSNREYARNISAAAIYYPFRYIPANPSFSQTTDRHPAFSWRLSKNALKLSARAQLNSTCWKCRDYWYRCVVLIVGAIMLNLFVNRKSRHLPHGPQYIILPYLFRLAGIPMTSNGCQNEIHFMSLNWPKGLKWY